MKQNGGAPVYILIQLNLSASAIKCKQTLSDGGVDMYRQYHLKGLYSCPTTSRSTSRSLISMAQSTEWVASSYPFSIFFNFL